MSGHTKGPWKVVKTWSDDPISEQTEIFHVESEDGSLDILVEGSFWYQDERDARLIASAPDLLEALEYLAADYQRKEGLGFDLIASSKMFAAIAKAKGDAK